jgi:hypothetical protein
MVGAIDGEWYPMDGSDLPSPYLMFVTGQG